MLGAIPIALALLANGLGTYAGAGTHFSSSSVGALSLDVASAWIPAGLLLVAAAAALPARGPIRGRIVVARSAVGLLPGLLLLWVARSELAGGELEPLSDQLLFAGLAAAVAGAAIASIPLARRSPAFALAGALVLAAVAPEAVWLATGMELLLGYGALPGVAPLAVLVVGYPLAGLWVLALIRRAGQASATQLPRRA